MNLVKIELAVNIILQQHQASKYVICKVCHLNCTVVKQYLNDFLVGYEFIN